VNITPTPGAERPAVEASYAVSEAVLKNSSTLAPGPSRPARNDNAVASCSARIPRPVSHQPRVPPSRISLLRVLLECLEQSRVPTTLELLRLMDAEDPAPDLKYVDVRTELSDHGIKDVVDLPDVELLATFGYLGMDGARRLHRYAREKMLTPLGLLETKGSNNDSSVVELTKEEVVKKEVAVEEVAVKEVIGSVATQATLSYNDEKNVLTQCRKEGPDQEAILRWLEGVEQAEGDVEVVDELSSTADEDDVASGPSEEV
jgi:hypothetical protein